MSDPGADTEHFRLAALSNYLEQTEDSREALANRFQPGSHGYHELVDRLATINQSWTDLITGHPAVLLHPGLYDRADRVARLIVELYEITGSRHLEANPTIAPERERWLWENPEATRAVLDGIADARAGRFAEPPDLEADARRFGVDMESD